MPLERHASVSHSQHCNFSLFSFASREGQNASVMISITVAALLQSRSPGNNSRLLVILPTLFRRLTLRWQQSGGFFYHIGMTIQQVHVRHVCSVPRT
jgi:hypothetical protein